MKELLVKKVYRVFTQNIKLKQKCISSFWKTCLHKFINEMQDIVGIYNCFIVFQKEMLIGNNNITGEIYHDL